MGPQKHKKSDSGDPSVRVSTPRKKKRRRKKKKRREKEEKKENLQSTFSDNNVLVVIRDVNHVENPEKKFSFYCAFNI